MLKEEGLTAVPAADLWMVVARDLAEPALAEIDSLRRQANRPWLLVQAAGTPGPFVAWFGSADNRIFCSVCLRHRLRINGWSSPAGREWSDTDSTAVRYAAAVALGRQFLDQHVAEIAPDGSRLHAVVPMPDCAACTSPHLLSWDLYISPLTGVVAGCQVRNIDDGLYRASAEVSRRLYSDANGNSFSGRRMHVGGKGTTAGQARISCMAEAFERSALAFTEGQAVVRATLAELGDLAIPPERIVRTGHTLPPGQPGWWTPVQSLRDGAVRYVPAGSCYFGFLSSYAPCDSNGCAAGEDSGSAVLGALLELLERDAVARWWHGHCRAPAVNRNTTPAAVFSIIDEFCRRRGRHWWLLDLTHEWGVAVAAAVSGTPDGTHVMLGTGAGLDMQTACWKAALEMIVHVDDLTSIQRGHEMDSDPEQSALFHWWDTANIADHPYLSPEQSAESRPASISHADPAGWVVEQATRRGLDCLMKDHSRADLPCPVVRVIVPGLSSPWSAVTQVSKDAGYVEWFL